jgi:polyhydroxybutyrate depolymerase
VQYLAVVALAGCATATGFTTTTPHSSGRHYELHLPAHPPPGRYPLVIALHGASGSGAHLEHTIGLDAIADREGFAVVYPDGISSRWNDGRPDLGETDDVGFIGALIDELATAHPIDRARVFAMGMSTGGMLAFRLGCELADKLVAIASVAGELPAPIARFCHPARPISVLAIHGTADPLVPFEGGDVIGTRNGRLGRPHGEVIGALRSVALFAKHDRCAAPTVTSEPERDHGDSTTVKAIEFASCTAGARVELLEIDGGGHAWPGGTGELEMIDGVRSRQLSASERIWQFFASLRR